MASLAPSFDSPVDPPLPDWHLGLRLEQNEVHFPLPIILKLKLSSAMIRSDFSFTRRHVKVKPFCLPFNGTDDLPDAATFSVRPARN